LHPKGRPQMPSVQLVDTSNNAGPSIILRKPRNLQVSM
jgi:hypothetical protein